MQLRYFFLSDKLSLTTLLNNTFKVTNREHPVTAMAKKHAASPIIGVTFGNPIMLFSSQKVNLYGGYSNQSNQLFTKMLWSEIAV